MITEYTCKQPIHSMKNNMGKAHMERFINGKIVDRKQKKQ